MDWLAKWATTTQSLALVCLDSGKQFSYPELYQAATRLAASMAQDVPPGARVTLLSTNRWEHVVTFFACLQLGAIFVPLNFRLSETECETVLKDASPSLHFYEKSFSSLSLRFGKETSSKVEPLESIEKRIGAEFDLKLTGAIVPRLIEDNLPSLMLYTSGTTGTPKGVLHSEQTMFWNALNTALRLGINFQTKHLCFHPFFHASGWNVLTLPTLRFGGTVYLRSKFEPLDILQQVEKRRVSILFGVPTMLERMTQLPEFENFDLSSLQFAIVGGEPMPLEAIKKWHKRGVPIRQGFGLTEFGPNVFSLNAEDAEKKLGSIGTPNFYLEVRVVDNNSQHCASNEVGELQLRGPVCMLGYWNKPEETQMALTADGWLKTGDLVSVDSDGYFYVRGRKKEMYISGGENIFPAEVERSIRSSDFVKEAAVVGVPDPKWGEVGAAFVVLHEDASLRQKDVIEHSKIVLAKYKVPKHFYFVKDLPKSDSGKILKRTLFQWHSESNSKSM